MVAQSLDNGAKKFDEEGTQLPGFEPAAMTPASAASLQSQTTSQPKQERLPLGEGQYEAAPVLPAAELAFNLPLQDLPRNENSPQSRHRSSSSSDRVGHTVSGRSHSSTCTAQLGLAEASGRSDAGSSTGRVPLSAPVPVRSECADSSMELSSGKWEGEDLPDVDAVARANNETSSITSTDKLPLKTKLLLGIGESVQGIYVVIGGYYLNSFLLETACIDPMYVGLVQAIQGAFDAINDPVIGLLSDKTRTRWGRRRPWLLFAAPFLAVFYFALWSALPRGTPQFVKFLYTLFVSMGVSAGITSIQVQIGALVPELTDDYDERTKVSAYRLFIGNLVGSVCALMHNQIINRGSDYNIDKSHRFRISGAIFSAIMCFSAWVTFGGIRERFKPRQESRQKLSWFDEVSAVWRNRAFRFVVGAYLFGPTAVALIQGNIFMFCKYVLKDPGAIELIIPAVQGNALLAMPLWVLLSSRCGKKFIYYVGGSGLILAVGSIFFVQAEYGIHVAVIISGVIGFCGPVVYLVPYSMLPDVIEEDELRTGKRREGLFVGFFTIVLKMSVTSALTITNFILKAGGYSAPEATCSLIDMEVLPDAVKLAESQPEVVVTFLRVLCGLLPAVFIFFGVICVWAFPIEKEKQIAMAKLAAQARMERCAAQSETSSVASTHSPRDVKELADFINDTKSGPVQEVGDKVLDAMTKDLCEAKYLGYMEQRQPARARVVIIEEGEEEEQPAESCCRGAESSVDPASLSADCSMPADSSMSQNARSDSTLTEDFSRSAGQSGSTRVPGDDSGPRTIGRKEGSEVVDLRELIVEKKKEQDKLEEEIRVLQESVANGIVEGKRRRKKVVSRQSTADSDASSWSHVSI